MSGKRGKSGDSRQKASLLLAGGALSTAALAATAKKQSNKEERNPLIDDLFDEMSQPSFPCHASGVGHLEGQSISNNGSFDDLDSVLRRSEEHSATCRDGARVQQQKEAVDVICRTSQHFVHGMQMHSLEDFFSCSPSETPEAALRRRLRSRSPQDLEAVVVMLVELLEEIRLTRQKVAPLKGSLTTLGYEKRERIMSASLFSTMSTASLMRPPVHETHSVAMAFDRQGNRMINCYTIIASLGQGAYGKVKVGEDASTGQKVAIKIIDKKNLKKKISGLGANDQDAALKREIAIMKKVRHRNCVSLYEVIDDPDSNKLYLIMDYIPNGPVVRLKPQVLGYGVLESIEAGSQLNGEVCNRALMRCAVRQRATGANTALSEAEMNCAPTIFLCRPLSQHVCALYLRQLVSGLRYMHKRNLVHHDIKPDNILLGTDHHVFLSDFGVSEILLTRQVAQEAASNSDTPWNKAGTNPPSTVAGSDSSDDDGARIEDRSSAAGPRLGAGTLLFTAPELFDPTVNQSAVDPYLTDVWALGVTLYCMLVGMSPFGGNSYAEVRTNILTQNYPWCGKNFYEAPLAAEWRFVLNGLLAKDPAKRWSLVRLKAFLDQESFQGAMQRSAITEASQCAPCPLLAGIEERPRSTKGSLPQGEQANLVGSLRAGGGKAPPMNGVASNANLASPRSLLPAPQNNRASLLPLDMSHTMRSYPWDLGVSEQEVREATRTVKVEVMRRKAVISAYTHNIVHNFVKRIRKKLKSRNCIQLSCSSPFRSLSYSISPLSTRMQTGLSRTSKTSSNSSNGVHVAHVPGASAAAKYQHLSDADPIGVNSLFNPRRRDSYSSPTGGATLQPGSGGYSTSGGIFLGDVASRLMGHRSQSLDAILSIVNLQSTSHDGSLSFTFSSSAGSCSRSCSPQHPGNLGRLGGRTGASGSPRSTEPPGLRASPLLRGQEVVKVGVPPHLKVPTTMAQSLASSSDLSSLQSTEAASSRQDPDYVHNSTEPPSRTATTSGALRDDGARHTSRKAAPPSHEPKTAPHDAALYGAAGTISNGIVNGYCASTSKREAVGPVDGYLAAAPHKKAEAGRVASHLDSAYQTDVLQQRLSRGRPMVAPITSFEVVPPLGNHQRRRPYLRKE